MPAQEKIRSAIERSVSASVVPKKRADAKQSSRKWHKQSGLNQHLEEKSPQRALAITCNVGHIEWFSAKMA
jgi:hypothetical protein